MNNTRNQMIRNLFKTYNLSFNNDELIESLDKDTNKPLVLEGKKTWMKEKPSIVTEIDKQLRKNFKISEKSNYYFTVYYPPTNKDKDLFLTESNEKVSKRIIIDTITENFYFKGMKNTEGQLQIKRWEALSLPPFSSNLFKFRFSNSKSETMPQRKGFRSLKRTKNIEKRYLLVFDYIVTDEDFDKINNMFAKKDNYKAKDVGEIDKAINDLIS